MGALVAFLGSLAQWVGASWVLKWLAQKALMTTLITTVLTVVLWNLLYKVLDTVSNWSIQELSGVSTPGAVSLALDLTGVGGYLASHFQLPACMAFVVAVCGARFAVKIIAGLVPGMGGLK